MLRAGSFVSESLQIVVFRVEAGKQGIAGSRSRSQHLGQEVAATHYQFYPKPGTLLQIDAPEAQPYCKGPKDPMHPSHSKAGGRGSRGCGGRAKAGGSFGSS